MYYTSNNDINELSEYNENRYRDRHVHEITGSTAIARECCGECHNHRYSIVSGEAVPMGCSHYHEVNFRTDYADGHYHEFCGKSSLAIEVGGGKHVHYVKGVTELADGHRHKFQAASLIESPLDFEKCE